MNLLGKLNMATKNRPLEPREIFMTLPSKAFGYGYPRDVQSEVWKKWYAKKDERNVIIKMNTGSGKTVVGLMILQSCLHEGKGPAVYSVPDNYLVKQVIGEANRLGIKVTDDKDDYNYSNSSAILVTTIQTIVNGRSLFGMRDSGSNYPIGSIIIDDVHACMDKINRQFMIRIDAEKKPYQELMNLFAHFLKDYNPKGYIDVVEMKDCRRNLLVPYWEWQRRQQEIYRILAQYCTPDNPSIFFGLPLIENCLDTCDCIITPSEIEISPKGNDIDRISSLVDAQRRIYMSATLADDSVFVSSLGLSRDDMKNIITPENANDIGDRFIIFPKLINNDITDEEIKSRIEKIAEKFNVVILVPSFNRAKFWDPESYRTADKDNIDKAVEKLKKEHLGIAVFVNRYDGIDLPGDSCRMLVIDGLPPLNSVKDKYIQSISPENTTLLREQVQRIEQGMGRGVRSNDDECCIVLMGNELSDVLQRNKGIDYFSEATRCQYDLSKRIWEILLEETKEKPSLDKIFEIANYSLEKNPEWVTACKEKLATVKYSSDPNVDNTCIALRKAFECSLNNQWRDAAETIKKIKDVETERKTKGLLCQIQAEYTNKYDSALSQEILSAGKRISAAILTPISGIQYLKAVNNIPQAQAIKSYFSEMELRPNDLMIYIDGILSKIIIGEEAESFEHAIDNIGKTLGFVCSRPDKDSGGFGPDNLWAVGNDKYFVIECKSESTAQTIKKDYCNQLSGHVNWFKEKYQNGEKCEPIIIHRSDCLDRLASPVCDMHIVTERELEQFRKSIRAFFAAICNAGNINDVDRISELLKEYKLRAMDILNYYTVSYRR